jgi:hypothetical protein
MEEEEIYRTLKAYTDDLKFSVVFTSYPDKRYSMYIEPQAGKPKTFEGREALSSAQAAISRGDIQKAKEILEKGGFTTEPISEIKTGRAAKEIGPDPFP